MKIGIAVSEWNSKITEGLFNGAIDTLLAVIAKRKHCQKKCARKF